MQHDMMQQHNTQEVSSQPPEVYLVIDHVDHTRTQKVYNLTNSQTIKVNPSYLDEEEGSSRDETLSNFSKNKKTRHLTVRNCSDDDMSTHSRGKRFWDRIKGKMTIRSEKLISFDSDSKIVRVSSKREDFNGSHYLEQNRNIITEFVVKCIIKDVLRTKFEDVCYNHQRCVKERAQVSVEIHNRLKEICQFMYKIVVNVFLGQVVGDGIESCTLCSSNPQTDLMVSGHYKNESLIAVVNVFLSYVP